MDAHALYATMLVLLFLLGAATITQWILWFNENYQWETVNSWRLMKIRIFGYALLMVLTGCLGIFFPQEVREAGVDKASTEALEICTALGALGVLVSLTILLGAFSGPISVFARLGRAIWNIL